MAFRVDVCALVAVLVVLIVALLLFAARSRSAQGAEGLTIWPIKWDARDN
jgi:hypothetical protein